MAITGYNGVGTFLSSNYYTRSFYVSNRDAATSSKRRDMEKTQLSLADSMALRRAVKQLGSFAYNSDHENDIRNSVKAYIETHNNLISSTSKSEDRELSRSASQLKSLMNSYKGELDKVGITVNEDGSLAGRDSLLSTASIDALGELFSGDSDLMRRSNSISKRIEQRSEELDLTEQIEKSRKAKEEREKRAAAEKGGAESQQKAETTSASPTSAVAQALAASAELDALLSGGDISHVDVVI